MKKLIVICLALAVMSVPSYADFTYTNTGISVGTTVPDGNWPSYAGMDRIDSDPVAWTSQEGFNVSGSGRRTTLGVGFYIPPDWTGHLKLHKIAVVCEGSPMTIDEIRLVDLGELEDLCHNFDTLPCTYPYEQTVVQSWGSFAFPGQGTKTIGVFEFTSDQAPYLQVGHGYSFEFVEYAYEAENFWLARGSDLCKGRGYCAWENPDNYPYGKEPRKDIRTYGGDCPSGDSRDYLFAIYLCPEPATVALLGLGALALLRKRS